jgi:hypothetical protein
LLILQVYLFKSLAQQGASWLIFAPMQGSGTQTIARVTASCALAATLLTLHVQSAAAQWRTEWDDDALNKTGKSNFASLA